LKKTVKGKTDDEVGSTEGRKEKKMKGVREGVER